MTGRSRWGYLLLPLAFAMVTGATAIPQQWVGFGLCLGAAVIMLGWAASGNRPVFWWTCLMLELLIALNAYLHYHRAMLAGL